MVCLSAERVDTEQGKMISQKLADKYERGEKKTQMCIKAS